MNISIIEPLMPEIAMTVVAMALIILELFIRRKETIAVITISSIVAGVIFIPMSFGKSFAHEMFINDGYSVFFKYIFFLNLLLSVLISIKYIKVVRADFGEYYSLMLLATIGMMIMASAGDLIVLYLGLELMALSTYVLAGFVRYDLRSNEAAIKYFLLGGFSSAIILFGITLIYAFTGTTSIPALAGKLRTEDFRSLFPVVFLLSAFGFKIALVPFHVWTPDVYEGAPTSVTAFMSVGPKAAGFSALGRVFLIGLSTLKPDWQLLLIILSIATMAVGNILAIQQRNLKRMLAYSSIAHAGYALMGLIAGGTEGVSATLNYLMIYAFMNIGAFSVLILLRTEDTKGEDLEEYRGLAKHHPLVAAVMLLFMFSLTGIPPTAGFIGKFYLFSAVVKAGLSWLAVVGVLFSAISAFFYLRVVMYMYMHEPTVESVPLSISASLGLAIIITTLAVVLIGIAPTPILSFANIAGLI